MILAGDIGGTKTVLSLLNKTVDNYLVCIQETSFTSADFNCFEDILDIFLIKNAYIESACFGVAGAVINQCCQLTNLNWFIDAESLKIKLATLKVKLLNDLEATALGMLQLNSNDLVELNPNAQNFMGNIAVIAAGTGLGEAILYWDGCRHHAMATEGGHADFAPQNAQQDELLHYLRNIYFNHVSYERIISGIGFSHLYDFLATQYIAPLCDEVTNLITGEDRNALISQLGVTNKDALCTATMNLFVQLYGAEAGNLALKSLSMGGVFIGGGIAPKILPALQSEQFLQAFMAKGRFQNLLSTLSIKVSLNPRTALLGAMYYFENNS